MQRKTTLLLVGLTLAGLATCVGLGRAAVYSPPPVQERPVHGEGHAPPLPRGTPITVMVWNAQFGAGTAQEFFYDGGTAVSVGPELVEQTLASVEEVVDEVRPDVILWQELDHDSRRTGHVDEVARLTRGWAAWVDAPYHKALYVPSPSFEHLGQVDMRLVVASRFGIASATRHQLALLDESAVRRVFNLKRAFLDTRVPLEGGGEVAFIDTHLSAFSKGDGTLGKQMAQLDAHLRELEEAGIPWLLAGDFNSLPPGDDPARLPAKDQPLYSDAETPVKLLFDHWTPAVPASELLAQPERWRTYTPFGAEEADRTLDYVFTGGGLEVEGLRVLTHRAHISDHLPLVVTVQVPPREGAP